MISMRSLTWIRRALRQGNVVTLRTAGPGDGFVVAELDPTQSRGGGDMVVQ